MPKKKNQETPEEQSARFVAHAQKMAEDGSLDPIEADKKLDQIIRSKADAIEDAKPASSIARS